ncbi:MAG TPA: trypsin-like serine protease [Rariglobus sp.]|nr:trypsin-like serine protease [Rariglobus sp.]
MSGSTTDTSDPGSSAWTYVGTVNGASGVYLGTYNDTYWVLTAGHVGLGDFTLDGVTYSAVTGSAISIYNNDSSPADLTLYQIASDPGLTALTIASTDQFSGTTVQMIGFGGGKSWGANTIYGYTNYTLDGYLFNGRGIVTLASGEGGNGGQGVGGDSGGGEFYFNGTTWVLAGILSGVGDIMNGSTDLGNGTIAVDLSVYRSQILADINAVSAIPEPATLALGMGTMVLGLTVWRRRRVG